MLLKLLCLTLSQRLRQMVLSGFLCFDFLQAVSSRLPEPRCMTVSTKLPLQMVCGEYSLHLTHSEGKRLQNILNMTVWLD